MKRIFYYHIPLDIKIEIKKKEVKKLKLRNFLAANYN